MSAGRGVVTAPLWRFLDGPVIEADCLDALRALPDESVDAVVTDPPYGIGFMGHEWDAPAIADAASRDAAQRRSLGPESASRPGRAQPRSSSAFGSAAHYAGPVRAGVDFQRWCEAWATEALRVLKPGGHMAVFGSPRTFHRLAAGIEDAGFEIRDTLMWLFGSGFPKSHDVSKAIDRRAEENIEMTRRVEAVSALIREYRERAGMERSAVSEAVVGTRSGACWNWEHHQLPSIDLWPRIKQTLRIPDDFDGLLEGDRARFVAAEREVVGLRTSGIGTGRGTTPIVGDSRNRDVTAPATPDARAWEGWGTALKPAYEPIVLARKPLAGTVAETVLAHGTGAIHIDACRLDGRERGATYGEPSASADFDASVGRWPANVLLDEAAAEMLDAQTGELVSGKMMPTHTTAGDARQVFGRDAAGGFTTMETYGDRGGASRFFYCAKTSRGERDAGLDGFPLGDLRWSNGEQSPGTFQSDGTDRAARNHHPTVKPIELMRWLLRLLTPPGGIVLDLFAGSGSTVCAGAIERIDVIGIEREPEYVAIARARAAWWAEQPEGLPVEASVQAARRRRARTEEGQFSMFDSEPAERAA